MGTKRKSAPTPTRSRPAKRITRRDKNNDQEDSDDQLDCLPTPSHPTRRVQFSTASLPSPPIPFPSPSKPSLKNSTQLQTPSLSLPPRPASPTKKILGNLLPHHHDCLDDYKRAILHNLQSPDVVHEDDEDLNAPANLLASHHVTDLLRGTTERNEGNSCLLLGPRSSGKTRIIEDCISQLPQQPIVVRLSGWIHQTDRLAMREIAYQFNQQISSTLLQDIPGDPDENPFASSESEAISGLDSISTAHLHALISCIPTLPRSTIVILDAFDLFTLHPRQSLLYSLLDTVQSLQMGSGNKGLAVVGLTTCMDTINMLEKRVKSRFSGRMIRTATPRKIVEWINIARGILMPRHTGDDDRMEVEDESTFREMWNNRVEQFLSDNKTVRILEETFSITRDVRTLSRLLIQPILSLTPASPWLTSDQLEQSAVSQRIRPPYPYLYQLNYPSLCLLIASVHMEKTGYPAITFEMLHECVRDRIRTSSSAPIQLNGRSIGMTFETLISARMFVAVAGPSSTTGKEFVRYRCAVHRQDIKQAVEKCGQTNLKTWLSKGY
ncbi:hypothetical protein K435DRAFT_676522 [Dendrothele bispora CBS 962.96]|uniref:Uncharacterized protein n=1 Tax=Dendrothele bispora (strain CBS 962.96) TaxID=1314807 RepID=A0A4S8LLH8_DENBC|nr:hypothetical protein K435DRAFT_676522 [Dendrothele bispora CBS 962.96]